MLLELSVAKMVGRSASLDQVTLWIQLLLKNKRHYQAINTYLWKKEDLKSHNLFFFSVVSLWIYSSKFGQYKLALSFSFYILWQHQKHFQKKKVAMDINGTQHRFRFFKNYLNYLMNQGNLVFCIFRTRALTQRALIWQCFLTTAMNH